MNTDRDFVWDTMKSLDFCMLVTHAEGGMRSRPMSSIVRKYEGVIYFLTDEKTAKDDEIEQNPNVLLTFSNGSSQFISTAGTAAVLNDRALIKQFWNPGAQAFWPEGPDTPSIRVLSVKPTHAEFWNGPSYLVGGAKMLLAAVTGSKPDLGENRKVAMR